MFVVVSIIVSLVSSDNGQAIAQITPDQTLSTENSTINLNTSNSALPIQVINGGATRGINLFHSFTEFNVNANSRVYFNNPSGIENILSRVTGSQSSQIFGTLGVLGNANLFLINPNGIVFGENATLDIRGSFLATTADKIKLGEIGSFNAIHPENSNLLSLQPGVLFTDALRQYQATITNQGNLTVGKNLTLNADNLDLKGQLNAGADLRLIAQNDLTIRDSQVKPFIAISGGNQLIESHQIVSISAISHPDSGFFAGNNMILRSDTIKGDAHYWTGGNFEIQKLDHSPGNLLSFIDPIIIAQGDVTLGNYSGSSLHILAGGSVTANYIEITDIDTTENSINPRNTNAFLASLAPVNLSNGKQIIIDGNKDKTLDIRAGINWDLIPNFPGNINTSYKNTTFTNQPTSAAINIQTIINDLTGGQEGEKAYVVRDTECGSKKR
ncbi:MAG: filamentous hemagglutinin N-terminal domain-containing protein [Cuspidothrix sp.]